MSEKELGETRELGAIRELPLRGEKWLEVKIQRIKNLLKIAEPGNVFQYYFALLYCLSGR